MPPCLAALGLPFDGRRSLALSVVVVVVVVVVMVGCSARRFGLHPGTNPFILRPRSHYNFPQGTWAIQCSEGTGTAVGVARTEHKNIAGNPLARQREWQHQQQDCLPQGEEQGRSSLFSPCLEGGLATLVLAVALLCRLGDFAQASCSCGDVCLASRVRWVPLHVSLSLSL